MQLQGVRNGNLTVDVLHVVQNRDKNDFKVHLMSERIIRADPANIWTTDEVLPDRFTAGGEHSRTRLVPPATTL